MWKAFVAIGAAAALLLAAQSVRSADAKKPASAPATTQAAPKIVNAKCPIMGSALDPDKVPAALTRTYKGQTVGFCCGGCPPAWDKLSDAEKDAKLREAMAK